MHRRARLLTRDYALVRITRATLRVLAISCTVLFLSLSLSKRIEKQKQKKTTHSRRIEIPVSRTNVNKADLGSQARCLSLSLSPNACERPHSHARTHANKCRRRVVGMMPLGDEGATSDVVTSRRPGELQLRGTRSAGTLTAARVFVLSARVPSVPFSSRHFTSPVPYLPSVPPSLPPHRVPPGPRVVRELRHYTS